MLKILLALIATCACWGQQNWNEPFPPHQVVGNLYFIGSKQLASFLITTPEGHILINSDFESTVPLLRENVEKLGFKVSDIKVILGSHAHGDHMEGDALLKEYTGARVMAMEQDVPALRAMRPGGKAHPIDRVLKDGDTVSLGGTTVTAYRTGGHTEGCTSWGLTVTDGGKQYNTLIVCSVGVNPDYILVGDKRNYPNIVQDYRASFAKLRAMKVDVFLGAHPNFYDMEARYAKRTEGGPNPFIDPAALGRYVDQKEREFNEALARQSNQK